MNLINPYLNLYQALNEEGSAISSSIRKNLIWAFSWAVPDTHAIQEITQYSPLIEIGAGSGYWAWLCGQAGADLLSFDSNSGAAPHWTPVLEGGPDILSQHPKRTLLLCWPPLNDPFAMDCLEHYSGRNVIYVGEWRGKTADSAFHDRLEKDFALEKQVKIPCWPGFFDQVFFFRRIQAHS